MSAQINADFAPRPSRCSRYLILRLYCLSVVAVIVVVIDVTV